MKNVLKISRSVQQTDAIYLDLDGAVKMEKKKWQQGKSPSRVLERQSRVLY